MATIYFRTKADDKLNGEFNNIDWVSSMMLAAWAGASKDVCKSFAAWVCDSAKGACYDCIEFYAEIIEAI